ncbi:rod shape-determining protein MreC [Aquifex aeolicus]|uniref:Cell shape-determining protein MreC n=1 Tax=Aquifex aeolicus (strain VF5) TaxID=224324 RepID=O67014_AQUAE|nr:rod shape-determining protein MreC [Aquifex aeolicus]AAC06978.1 putative protein [Aquifex aeolicus VF5]
MSLKKLNVYFFLLSSLSLLLLLLQNVNNPFTQFIRNGAFIALSPILKVQAELEEEVRKGIEFLKDLKEESRLITKYNKLKEEILIYKEKVNSYEKMLQKLEKDLDFNFPTRADYVISKIIFYDTSGKDLFFIIRDGQNKGIKKGDLVVARGGVVGVVDEVYYSTSKVISLFNENTYLLATVNNSDKVYVYHGGYPHGELLYVDVNDTVNEGDVVLFKDLTMKVPAYKIGSVVYSGISENPFFKKVKVEPYVSPREVEFVVVFKE